MATLSLDYAQMRLVAGNLDKKQQHMATELHRIKLIADSLVSSDFKTVKAAPQFHTTVADTVQSLAKAITAIGQYAEVLRTAAKAYHEADGKLAEQIDHFGATETLKVDLAEIGDLKANLKTAQSAFNDVHDVSSALGADVLGHDGLAGAVHDFSHDWEKKRKEIIKNADEIYAAVANIDQAFNDIDTDLNANLQGKGN